MCDISYIYKLLISEINIAHKVIVIKRYKVYANLFSSFKMYNVRERVNNF